MSEKSKSENSKPLPAKRRAQILQDIGIDANHQPDPIRKWERLTNEGWKPSPGPDYDPDKGAFPEQLLRGIDDARRTGLRATNPEEEDSPVQCNAEWHFARLTGEGSKIAPLIYGTAMRVAGDGGTWSLSAQKIAKFLNVEKDDYVYAAIDLLVTAGFFEVIEETLGRPTKYRPMGHRQWAAKHPGFCTAKHEFPFQDETTLAALGRKLHGILGGETFFTSVLINFCKTGLTPDEICQHARQFLELDKGQGGGKERRKRFGAYLREQAASLGRAPL